MDPQELRRWATEQAIAIATAGMPLHVDNKPTSIAEAAAVLEAYVLYGAPKKEQT